MADEINIECYITGLNLLSTIVLVGNYA